MSDGLWTTETRTPIDVAELRKQLASAQAEINAWHSTFRTSQLSHALARLEQAEKMEDKYRKALEAVAVLVQFYDHQEPLKQIKYLVQQALAPAAPQEKPHPMLCFQHGGSGACEDSNRHHGFICPKCEETLCANPAINMMDGQRYGRNTNE